jgi:uncharacterized membrane protein YfcA
LETADLNITEDALEIVIGILLVLLGGIYIFSPQRFCREWPPEQQARLRKLARYFIGPALILLGLAWLAYQFTG